MVVLLKRIFDEHSVTPLIIPHTQTVAQLWNNSFEATVNKNVQIWSILNLIKFSFKRRFFLANLENRPFKNTSSCI